MENFVIELYLGDFFDVEMQPSVLVCVTVFMVLGKFT